MRILLMALMIALLPLRGWFGDAMATSMAVAAVSTDHHTLGATNSRAHRAMDTETAAGSSSNRQAMGHAQHPAAEGPTELHQIESPPGLLATTDCADHGGHAAVADDGSADGDHCGTCALCVTCHTSAIQASAWVPQASISPQATPLRLTRSFASADAALGQKPPIS